MKNFVQAGDSLTLTAPVGGVVSGAPLLMGVLLVVPAVTVAAGLPFAAKVNGVYDFPAATSQAWTEGALLYWDETNKVFTTTESGNTKKGVAVAAKLAATATGRVKLIQTL